MNVALWIIASVLAAVFLAAGVMKVSQPKEKLAAGMAWTEDFGPSTIKAIGALEILAAIGLILPAVVDIAPVLVPVAAIGLTALMSGAAITHLRRKELQMIVINVVIIALAVVVAWGRFGTYAF